jgi:DNA-binding CsgD family transcriptional regulator
MGLGLQQGLFGTGLRSEIVTAGLMEFSAQPPESGGYSDIVHQCIPWGILIIDEQRHVLFANSRARAFLVAKGGLEQRGGRIHVERANVDRALGDLLKAVFATGQDRSPPADPAAILGVPDREGRTRYALKIIPCATDQARVGALLVVADLTSEARVSRSAVARTFQFSAREAELAELFSSGLRIDAIAGRMGISSNTARIHLRNVFAKTGCANQVELARLFAHMP